MQIQLTSLVWSLAGLIGGTIVGASFGAIQDAASRRHRKREQAGKLNSAWAIVPGSMRRVAFLLATLALIQVTFPLLFTNGFQWWVSGGVVAGYGTMLFLQLRHRMSETH